MLFELGLFMGALGREKTFVVTEEVCATSYRSCRITTANFERDEGANMIANLGPVVTKRFQMERPHNRRAAPEARRT